MSFHLSASVGIGMAFIAMLCWGFGDFLIQKSTRKVGDWEALFFITIFGALITLPFVWRELPTVLFSGSNVIWILFLASLILFIGGILDFEALRRGKLSIVEPIWSLEVPVAAVLAFFLVGERITIIQIILIVALVACLILVAFREKKIHARIFMEKGVIFAILGGTCMGAANFFMGWGGRVTDPLIINFISDVFIFVVSGIYLIGTNRIGHTIRDIKQNYGVLIPMSIADKAAWVAYVFAMVTAPIAVATALSESYIIIAVLLGLAINKEKIHIHQKVGLVGAIIVAITLAVITT